MAKSRYNPTPEQIRCSCVSIRATWTEREHRRRAGWSRENVGDSYRWVAPEYNALQLGLIDGKSVTAE